MLRLPSANTYVRECQVDTRAFMLRWLDRLPLAPLALAAVVLGFSPLLPEPHLLQKLGLLFAGQLAKPVDVADLVVHASLPLVLLLKWVRIQQLRRHPRK